MVIVKKDSMWEYKRIQINTLTLENTRLLYDGISRLCRQIPVEKYDKLDNPHANICGMNDFRDWITSQTAKKLARCFDENGQPLYLNTNINFCLFWKFFFGEEGTKPDRRVGIDARKVGDMIMYYDLIQHLVVSHVKPDDKPYYYENLCWYISNIMGCDMSYFVQRDSCNAPRIICRSGYDYEELRDRRSPKGPEFESLLSAPEKSADHSHSGGRHLITDDIWYVSVTGGEKQEYVTPLHERHYVVIRLDQGRGLYLLLQYNNDGGPVEDEQVFCKTLTRLLFLREDLTQSLRADFEYLLNLRFDCSFVRFFEAEGKKPESDCPVIMHIADLHMDDVARHLINEIDTAFSEYYRGIDQKVDLLVLSGDIAEGKEGNASQLQRNYRTAEKILLKIAYKLWARDDKRLPFDWKRRIICVPGNHDFAAMNLVKAAFMQRSLAAGLPHYGENEIVAKFAYYLDFMVQFLDAPIDELIYNNINEVREYRNMGVKLMLLNSSCGATSSRTNKVCLDEASTSRLASSKMWSNCEHMKNPYRICVVHHPPQYTIDYTLDGYDTPPGWDWGEPPKTDNIAFVYKAFRRALLRKKNANAFLAAYERFDRIDNGIGSLNRDAVRNNATYFTKDAQILYKYLKKEKNSTQISQHEEINRLYNQAAFNEKMGVSDQREYRASIKKMLTSTGIHLFLAGHVHVADKHSKTIIGSDIDWNQRNILKQKTLIGGRFINFKKDRPEEIDHLCIQTIIATRGADGKVQRIEQL